MFDHLFENRNSTVTNLLKLGDCLGRSLRENIELFSIDSEAKKVAYLSEEGKVISGEYDFDENITFSKIQVQESDIKQLQMSHLLNSQSDSIVVVNVTQDAPEDKTEKTVPKNQINASTENRPQQIHVQFCNDKSIQLFGAELTEVQQKVDEMFIPVQDVLNEPRFVSHDGYAVKKKIEDNITSLTK